MILAREQLPLTETKPFPLAQTFCLRHIKDEGFTTIHFFGDKTFEGGNDFEIFSHKSVTGHSVTQPGDTIAELNRIFNLQ